MSVTAIHIPYKEKFEPIVLPEEYIALARSTNEDEWEFYRVKYIEPFFIEYTSPTIVNGGSYDAEIDELKLGRDEIAQIRFMIDTDGFEVEVKLPEAVSRYSTRGTVNRVKKWVTDNYPHLTEMFYWRDVIPIFRIYNKSGADGSATLKIIGFRYILERVAEKPPKYTVIYVTSIPSRT